MLSAKGSTRLQSCVLHSTDILRDGDSPRIYVKPDGRLVEIAAEIRGEVQPTDWVDATVKRDELRNAIVDVLAIGDALGE